MSVISSKEKCCICSEESPQCVLNVCRLHVNWWSWRETWSVQRSVLRWQRRKSTPAPWKLTPTQEPLYIIHVVIVEITWSLLWQHVILHIHLSWMNSLLYNNNVFILILVGIVSAAWTHKSQWQLQLMFPFSINWLIIWAVAGETSLKESMSFFYLTNSPKPQDT